MGEPAVWIKNPNHEGASPQLGRPMRRPFTKPRETGAFFVSLNHPLLRPGVRLPWPRLPAGLSAARAAQAAHGGSAPGPMAGLGLRSSLEPGCRGGAPTAMPPEAALWLFRASTSLRRQAAVDPSPGRHSPRAWRLGAGSAQGRPCAGPAARRAALGSWCSPRSGGRVRFSLPSYAPLKR